MAREAFLINPPKSLYSRKRSKSRRRTINKRSHLMNAWPEKGIVVRKKFSPLHSKAALLGWGRKKKVAKKRGVAKSNPIRRRKRTTTRRRAVARYPFMKHNPFGEEVILVGANPKKRRKVSRKISTHVANPRKKHARKHNPIIGRKRHSRRRHRRNPATTNAASFNFMKPNTLIMPIASGLVAMYAISKVPAMVGQTTGWGKKGVELAIAVGGTMLAKKMLGNNAAMAFGVVSGTYIAWELFNQYVLATPGFSGIPYNPNPSIAYQPGGYAAFPRESAGFNAFPYEG